MNRYTLRRLWRQLLRRFRGPQPAGAGPVVTAFLEGASARECAYRYWYQGASVELATATDWPEAVKMVEQVVREHIDDLATKLDRAKTAQTEEV